MLRVAMLSYWHVHAPDYTRQIQEIPDTRITVIWDENTARGQEWAAKTGATFVPDLTEAINRPDVDAVIVNAATRRHVEVMVAAAQAHKHIFTEKVLAPTVAEADRIIHAVETAGVQFCISLPHLSRADIRFARQAIKQGWLGQVTLLRARIAHTGVADHWLPAHFLDPEQTGGGALIDLGAHPMYVTDFLLGLPQRVSARFTQVDPNLRVEDNAVAVLEYANGSLAVVESSFTSRFSPFTVEAHGTEGTLFIGWPGSPIQMQSRQVETPVGGWLRPERLPQALPTPLQQWVRAIRTGEPVEPGLQAARHLTELMEAANRSAQQGRPIELPL